MLTLKEILSQFQERRWAISLATHLGTDIENETSAPTLSLSPMRRKQEDDFRGLVQTRSPTAGYNCYGQVFALRRTAIYDPKFVDLILVEDGYGEIADDHDAKVGDVVIYSDDSGFDHAARIIRFDELRVLSEAPPKPIPVVLSKFDDVSGEYEHKIDDLRWAAGRKMSRRIFRDRHVLPKKHPDWRETLLMLEKAAPK